MINPGRWKPFQRASNTIVVAYTLAAIIGLGVIDVGVGGVNLSEFIRPKDGQPIKPELSFFIGFVTGFAFPYVRDLMQQVRPGKHDGAEDKGHEKATASETHDNAAPEPSPAA